MTREEQIEAAIEAFFANRSHKEQEKAMVMELIMGSHIVIGREGELIPDGDLKGKRIAIIGGNRTGLTQPFIEATDMSQKIAYVDSLTDEQRREQKEIKDSVKTSIFPAPLFDPPKYTPYEKGEAKRYGNNKKHKKRRRK